EAVSRLPMVARLVGQLGFDVASLVQGGLATEPILDASERAFNVFPVTEALGSPYVPAHDFVERHGVRSVLGYGGLLPDGQLFAIIMFARVPISRETAQTFQPLTLATKLALLPFVS